MYTYIPEIAVSCLKTKTDIWTKDKLWHSVAHLLSVIEWVSFWELTIRNTENIFRLELYRLHVSVQIVAYFKKCVSRLPSASGYPSRCCVVVYKGNLIPKLQEMFWCVATIFRTHQMLTKKGNICACSQRFFANEHSKEKWCWRTLSSPSQRKLTQLTFTVRNASCGKTLRCTSQWM